VSPNISIYMHTYITQWKWTFFVCFFFFFCTVLLLKTLLLPLLNFLLFSLQALIHLFIIIGILNLCEIIDFANDSFHFWILTTVKAGKEQHHLQKKVIIAIVVATTSLAALVFSFLCCWIYHSKCPTKSKTKKVQIPCPGTYLFTNVPFLMYPLRKISEFDSMVLSEITFFPLCCAFECQDAEKGITLPPFLSRFSSIKIVGMKESVPIVDYKQIEKTTNNFQESNILGEGGFGCVYKARLDHNLDVAVKKLHCETQNAEREFEVIYLLVFCFLTFFFFFFLFLVLSLLYWMVWWNCRTRLICWAKFSIRI